MKRIYNLIFFVFILFVLLNISKVFATDSAQIQNMEQNVEQNVGQSVEQNVDKTKEVDSMGIYKMPDDLTYSDSSRIYLNNGIILFKFIDGSYQLVSMMSKDIVKSANFDGNTDNIVINFSYNNVMINGSVILAKANDNLIHNTVVGEGNGKAVIGIDVKVAPKYSYIQNYDNLDLKLGVLQVFYDDGSIGIVKMTDPEVMVEGFDNTVPGEHEVTVKYKGFEDKFKVKILENYNPAMNGKIPEKNNENQKSPEYTDYKDKKDNNKDNNGGNNNPNNPPNNNPKGPDNTTAKGLLPQTGAIPFLIGIIVIFGVVGSIVYIKKVVIKKGIRGR